MSLVALRHGGQTAGWDKDFEPSLFSADWVGIDEVPSKAKAPKSKGALYHLVHGNLLAAEVRTALQGRLLQLRTDFLEDFGRDMSGDSIEDLWTLMNSSPNLVRPSLTAEPSGNLIASWRKSPVESLSVRFMGASTLHYSLVVPAAAAGGNPERRWGEADVASFFRSEPTAQRFAT